MMQWVAVYCIMLSVNVVNGVCQCPECSLGVCVLQCVAVCCSVLQWVLEYCIGSSVVYYVAVNVTKAVCRCPKCFLEVRVLQ